MTHATYSMHPTPVGEAVIVSTDDGVVALALTGSPDTALAGVAERLGVLPERDDDRSQPVTQQLDEYFDTDRRRFDVDIDWSLVRGFTGAALQAICEIPYGETASYGEIAALAGSPRAHRAVGSACASSPFSLIVPVHRVVHADGSIGGYGGHPGVKRFLLDLERDAVDQGGAGG